MSHAERNLLNLAAFVAIFAAGACTIYTEDLLFDDSRTEAAGGYPGSDGLGPGAGGHVGTAGAPGLGGSSSGGRGGATSDDPGVGGQVTGAGGQVTGIGGEVTGAGGEATGAGGQVTGAGGQVIGGGGQATGTGGQVAGAAGQVTGAGGQVTGIGGQVAGAAGQVTGTGGEVTGTGGEVTGTGGASGGLGGTAGASPGGTGGVATGGAAGSGTGGSGTGGATDPCADGTPDANDLVVDLADTRQTMDGFGASDFWLGEISDADADLFFDRDLGIGLSILRVGISPTGDNHAPWLNIEKAAARGAIVWATPLSPPAECKSNDSVTDGGHLLQSCYESWSDTLAAFAGQVRSNTGADLYGVSAQSGADNVMASDSCVYTAAEMNAFVKVLGPKLHALTPPVRLLAPEPSLWTGLWGSGEDYGNAILGDTGASAAVDILATHQYGSQVAVAPPPGVTHHIWETETSGIPGSPEEGPSADIRNGVVVAQWIHDGIAVGEASAWHYWWLRSLNDDNEGLQLQDGAVTKRLYTMGNFSKFVRPGFQRVGVSGLQPSGVQVSAYRSPADGAVAIVAINSNTNASPVSVFISGGAPCEVTPWVTSAADNLAPKNPVSISAARFTTTLAAQSVTTFAGTP